MVSIEYTPEQYKESYFAIKCICEECSDNSDAWLARAEKPEKGMVTFPKLGVFNFGSKHSRICFEKYSHACAVIGAIAAAHGNSSDNLRIFPVPKDNKAPCRLEG